MDNVIKDKSIEVTKSQFLGGLKNPKENARAKIALIAIDNKPQKVEYWESVVNEFLNQKVKG